MSLTHATWVTEAQRNGHATEDWRLTTAFSRKTVELCATETRNG
jgi:hypothetical protein